jgi:hypothetical protein
MQQQLRESTTDTKPTAHMREVLESFHSLATSMHTHALACIATEEVLAGGDAGNVVGCASTA